MTTATLAPSFLLRRSALLGAFAFAVLGPFAVHAEPEVRGAERIAGSATEAGLFGIAVTALDFDGDGQNEIAIADPLDTPVGGSTRGVVRILRRTVSGWQTMYEASIANGSYLYGYALASGDFDDDGRDDLLIGAPGHGNNGGAVYMVRHTGPGSVSEPGVILNNGANFGQCGWSLAVGDFNGDLELDFATGCPTASFDGMNSVGRVQVAYGSGNATFSMSFLSQATAGIAGAPETGDRFGLSLAAGNFDCLPGTDLAIGAPGEGVGSAAGAGAVHVLIHDAGAPLSGTGSQLWHEDVAGVPGVAGNGDAFATSLAAGDFDIDSEPPFVTCQDLAIGIPRDAESPGGSVLVMQATLGGLAATESYRMTIADMVPPPGTFPPHPVPDANRRLGVTLLAGGFGRGAASDLAIGVEGYTQVLGSEQPGLVCIAFGAEDVGLLGDGRRCFSGAEFGFGAANDSTFGSSLARANLDDASGQELVIGARGTKQVFVLRNGLFNDGFELNAD
jgi:hypothetical protein